MDLLKVALCSTNTTVGAVRSNLAAALGHAQAMAADGVSLAVFQEQLLGGYPPEDLVLWRRFVDTQWTALGAFARETARHATVFVLGLNVSHEGQVYNAAAVVHGGRVLGVVPKEKLPTYGVFYEGRTLGRGGPWLRGALAAPAPALEGAAGGGPVPFGDHVFRFAGFTLAVEVCEDLWSPDGPMRRRCFSGAEVVANVSASPYRVGVVETRRELIATRAADNEATVLYANAVGGNDGLVFDGGGFVNQCGRTVLEAPRWHDGWAAAVVDLDRARRRRAENSTWRADQAAFVERGTRVVAVDAGDALVRAPGARPAYPAPAARSYFLPAAAAGGATRDARAEFCEDMLDCLTVGLGDYFVKTGAFERLGIAFSGGRDSALAVCVAARVAKRLGRAPGEVVSAFYMPTRFNSEASTQAAEALCRELQIPLKVLPIEEAFAREVEAVRAMLPPGAEPTPITLQNIQARLRALRMWNWANSTRGLFVQCGNMTEKAAGYTTVGGDLSGALGLIANVPKTVVLYLLGYLRDTLGSEALRQVLAAPASPELAEGQEGEKELMPFPVLDACFWLYAMERLAPDEVAQAVAAQFPEHPRAQIDAWVERFVRLFTQSIFKWVQAPLSLHLGNLDLERERALQLPVVQSGEWRG